MFNLAFNHAALLGLLVVTIPAVGLFWLIGTASAKAAQSAYAEDKFLRDKISTRSQYRSLAVWQAILTLLVVALAGPTLMESPQHAKAGSLQVVFVMDVSNSMGAEDYKSAIPEDVRHRFVGEHGNRIDMAKYIIETQVMPALAGNELGLVTYKGVGFEQAPLTDDYQSLDFVLDNWVTVGQAPCCGSHYEEGIRSAISEFSKRPNPGNAERVIVLFSDGGYDGKQADLDKVIAQLKKQHIRLVVLGLGTSNPVKVPLYDSDGKFTGYFQVNGKDAYTQIDEANLRNLAREAGGEYHHIVGSDIGVKWPAAVAGRDKVESEKTNVFRIPLGAAIFLLLGYIGYGAFENKQRSARLWQRVKANSAYKGLLALFGINAGGKQ